jgi:hypothetical protein
VMFKRSKLLLAFDAASVQGARIEYGLGGRRVAALARRTLEAGALQPLALEPNVTRAEEVRAAARTVVAELGGTALPAIVVLPDGVARVALLDVPAGTAPRDYARFRVAPQLPYPAAEAIVDVVPAGGGRYLAAAVRRDIAAEYEALAEAAGVRCERVDLAPLAALAVLHRPQKTGAPRLDVVLGEAAFSVALFAANAPVAFRSRRRERGDGDVERVGREVERTALLGPAGARPQAHVVGAGARRLAETLGASGLEARPGWGDVGPLAAPETEELAWLAAALS